MDKNCNAIIGMFPKSEEIRKLFYSYAIDNPEHLNESEFYKVIEYYFQANDVENSGELAQGFRNDNYFYTRLSGDSIDMHYDDFTEVINELCLVIKGGLDDNDMRLGWDLEETELIEFEQ